MTRSNDPELFPEASRNLTRLTARKRPIRPLVEDDLEQIADLFKREHGDAVQRTPEFLKQVFFEPPWRDNTLPSLVYEDGNGGIIGCLGRMPRHMKFRGRTVRVAVGHHFMVERSRRGTMAGVELGRQFLSGLQDLALAGGGDFSRRIWEYLGGSVCLLYSFCWTRVMRPTQYGLSNLNERGLAAAAQIARPLCRAVDATLEFIPRSAFRFQSPDVLGDDLDNVTLLACLSAFSDDRSLQPVYDHASLTWLMKLLEEKRHRGTLHKVAVRTHSGRALGWYLYYLGATSVAEVLQVGGKDDTIRDVLDHLFHHAWQRGAIAVTGPMDPRLCGTLSENHCTFRRPDHNWMLIHSQDQRIANAMHAGDAFLSRLEAEWWIAA
jgi:hypothetical protein